MERVVGLGFWKALSLSVSLSLLCPAPSLLAEKNTLFKEEAKFKGLPPVAVTSLFLQTADT